MRVETARVRGQFSHPTSIYVVQEAMSDLMTRGGENLYDKYIMCKLPQNAKEKVSSMITNIFQPVVSRPETQRGIGRLGIQPYVHQIKVINQSILQKNIADKGQKGFSQDKTNNQEKNQMKNYISPSIKIESRQKKQYEKSSTNKKIQKCHGKKPVQKSQIIYDSNSPNYCFKNRCDKIEKTDEQQHLWIEKYQQYNKKLQRQDDEHKKRSQQAKHKSKIETQYRTLQLREKTITFDHNTCRVISLEEQERYIKRQYKRVKKDRGVNHLKFSWNLQGSSRVAQGKQPEFKQITNIRKIMSSSRPSRFRNHNSHNDHLDFNNNGERQNSTIPYISLNQGLNFIQEPKMNSPSRYRPQTAKRAVSSSLTSRTFKSFARDHVETDPMCRTIKTAPEGQNRRVKQTPQNKSDRKTTANTVQKSILWSSNKLNARQNHAIFKSKDFFNLFQSSDQIGF